MISSRRSKFIESNQGLYREKIIEVFNNYSEKYDGWYNIFKSWNCFNPVYGYQMFGGAEMDKKPYLNFDIFCFYSSYDNNHVIKDLAKEAENRARLELGVPKIGEGWISETILYKQIEAAFPETKVIQHGKPEWLNKQHFDVWMSNWNIALEYQGLQHYQPVEIFGGKEGYEKVLYRDEKKKNLCKRHKVKLLVVNPNYDIEEIKLEIRKIVSKRDLNILRKYFENCNV